MSKIFIIEDEFLYRDQLKKIIHNHIEPLDFLNHRQVHAPININDFYKTLNAEKIDDHDLFIIDIDLKMNISGITIAKTIRALNSYCFIVFFTSHPEYTHDVLTGNILPFSYLLKKETIKHDNDAEIINILRLVNSVIAKRQLQNRVLELQINTSITRIPYDNIIFIQTIKNLRNTVNVVTKSGSFICNRKITDLKKELADTPFYTNLYSFIINVNEIREINKTSGIIKFANQMEISVGTRIINKLSKYLATIKN